MPKKNKTLCVDDLRHAEYYGDAASFDELYHRGFGRRKFYRPYGFNSEPGQHSSGISEHQSKRRKLHSRNRQQNISDIGCLPPETVAEKVRFIVTGSQHGYRPKPVRPKDIRKPNRQNQTVRYSLYLGPAGTAMYQAGHGANLRSEDSQRQQLRLSPEPFRGTRRAENLHHASAHEPALCD